MSVGSRAARDGVTPSRGVFMYIAATGQALIERPPGPPDPVIASFLAPAAMAVADFEAVIEAPDAEPARAGTRHVAGPGVMDWLRRAGLSALAHANNHAFDLGAPGLRATRAVAARAGLALAGSGADLDEAAAPARVGACALLSADLGPQAGLSHAWTGRAGIQPLKVQRELLLPPAELGLVRRLLHALGEDERRAMRVRAGMSPPLPPGTVELFGQAVVEGEATAFQWAPDAQDLARIGAALGAAGPAAVLALHSHHWDPDWTRPPPWFLGLCRGFVEAGACAVVGTGVPVLQPLCFHAGRPVFPGLGNFVFHTHRPDTYDQGGIDVWSGAVCRWRVGAGAGAAVEVLPLRAGRLAHAGLAPEPPRPLRGDAALRVMARLTDGLSPAERARVLRVEAGAAP